MRKLFTFRVDRKPIYHRLLFAIPATKQSDALMNLWYENEGIPSINLVRRFGSVVETLKRPFELDSVAIHQYLTFSFIPTNRTGIRNLSRALHFPRPGEVPINEQIEQAFSDESFACEAIDEVLRKVIVKGLSKSFRYSLYLSGGLDSSAVAVYLKDAGQEFTALSLDFGEDSVEKIEAQQVADHLAIPLIWVPCNGELLKNRILDLAYRLDTPFGDPVTGPQLLLGEAAKSAGMDFVYNGEGGDQLFGGWTNKPMIAAQLFDTANESRETMYLRSYHRFHGLEKELYTSEFLASIGDELDCTPLLAPYLSSDRAKSFLGRLRLADLELKGYENIIPRMNRIADSCGLQLRAPLFDHQLTKLAFQLPPQMKLRGTCEKYILKKILHGRLPDSIVHRRKSGMCVPVTEWVRGPLKPVVDDFLSDETVRRRGLFRPEYVARLRNGETEPNEIRHRRLGEKIWTLLMLEAWMRVFIDGRGRKPESNR